MIASLRRAMGQVARLPESRRAGVAVVAVAVPALAVVRHRRKERREQLEQQMSQGGIAGLSTPQPSLARARSTPSADPNMLHRDFNVHPELNGAPELHGGTASPPVVLEHAQLYDATYRKPSFDATEAIEVNLAHLGDRRRR